MDACDEEFALCFDSQYAFPTSIWMNKVTITKQFKLLKQKRCRKRKSP